MTSFAEILDLARKNIAINPIFSGLNDEESVERYITELESELKEVRDELRPSNAVYLTDELSDVIWDYTVLLALLEKQQLITSVEEVFKHSMHKYQERSLAFTAENNELWDSIKSKQKNRLTQRHQEKYGN